MKRIFGGKTERLKMRFSDWRSTLQALGGITAFLVGVLIFQNCSGGFTASSSLSSIGKTILPSDIVDGIGGGIGGDFFGKGGPPPAVQSRSRFELLFAAQDLLGDPSLSVELIKSIPADPKVAGFESAATQHYDEAYMSVRMEFAEAVAQRVIRSNNVFNCQPTMGQHIPFDGCVRDVLLRFAERAFRRPLSGEERNNIQQIFHNVSTATMVEISTGVRRPPHGYLDNTDGMIARGWSLDPDWPERTVEIHFYVDGTFVGNAFANQPRPDVNAHFQSQGLDYKGDHGFAFRIPDQYADGHIRTIVAYAIGNIENPELGRKQFGGSRAGDLAVPPQLSAPTEEAVKAVVSYVLMSPAFQLRVTKPNIELSAEQNEHYEIANKMVMFVSGGLPDHDLLENARTLRLKTAEVYDSELRRLIRQNADRFVGNVIGQWMGTREFSMIETLSPLEQAMVQESRLVFKEILTQNLSSQKILRPGFTFVNSALAQHYGIAGVNSGQFVKVTHNERGGILSQGALLRATAPVSETKPIIRGKWVQANILCRTIPPPDAELFQQIENAKKAADPNWSVSEKLAQHRAAGKVCNSCHQYMDPLGLALENYGPFGLWRDRYDDKKPVIAAGELDGKPFNNVHDLVGIVEQREDFRDCVVMKMMTHALSRPVAPEELAYLKKISREKTNFADILLAIAKIPSFLEPRKD